MVERLDSMSFNGSIYFSSGKGTIVTPVLLLPDWAATLETAASVLRFLLSARAAVLPFLPSALNTITA